MYADVGVKRCAAAAVVVAEENLQLESLQQFLKGHLTALRTRELTW